MPINEEEKRRIIDLHFHQHKTIREVSRIIGKSSHDITPVTKEYRIRLDQNSASVNKERNYVNAIVKDYRQNLRLSSASKREDSKNNNTNQKKEEPSNYSVNAMAYRLYSQGLSPLQVTIELGLLEKDATEYYLEYTRLLDLVKLPQILRILGNVRAVNYFLKLSNLALAEGLTTEEVVQLVNIVENNSISSVQKRIDEIKIILSLLENELGEQKDLLSQFNEKTTSAETNLAILKKACKETRDEFIKLSNEKNSLEKWVFEFKHNNDEYLEVQNIVKEKVEAFLTEYNGRKLLEYALTAAVEALKQDPQREQLVKTSIANYNFDPDKLFFPNPYDYSELKKEKLFELASETCEKLVKGLTPVTLSTATEKYAGIVSY